MSGRTRFVRVLAAAAVLFVAALGVSVPTAGQALPLPQATTAVTTPPASASPAPSSTPPEDDDEPTDDGTNPMPPQTGTWVAVGAAAGVALLAGLVVALRKR